jgi:intracellular sulfur oxidation DsrE/DsrF family protein
MDKTQNRDTTQKIKKKIKNITNLYSTEQPKKSIELNGYEALLNILENEQGSKIYRNNTRRG